MDIRHILTDFKNTDNLPVLLTYAGRNHSLVVIGVDTHVVTLEVEGKLAVFDVFQFILVQVRPPPQPGVDDVREPFTSSHLGTTRENEYRVNTFVHTLSLELRSNVVLQALK